MNVEVLIVVARSGAARRLGKLIAAKTRPLLLSAAVGCATQSHTDQSGTSVFRYGSHGETYIDRFFAGSWHSYGPYR
jgi:hypothetical protein